MIELNQISKTFRVPIRASGMRNAMKSFFHRKYRIIKAIEDINLSIGEGEIVGYIGPNGAGKSTTIKVLSGILTPDKGTVRINGIDPISQRKQNASQIGVVFGQRTQLWWDLPVGDSFHLIKEIYKIPQRDYQLWLDELVELFDLTEVIKSPVRQLSLGQRVKCDIVSSLLHNPKVLFLDEPTIGLDAYSKKSVRYLIKEINRKYNTTVILTTHDMQDINELASRVVLIGEGRILYDGTLPQLKSKYMNKKMISLNYTGYIIESNEYNIVEKDNCDAILELNSDLSAVIQKIQETAKIIDITVKESDNLDDVVVKLYEDHQL